MRVVTKNTEESAVKINKAGMIIRFAITATGETMLKYAAITGAVPSHAATEIDTLLSAYILIFSVRLGGGASPIPKNLSITGQKITMLATEMNDS